MAEWTQAQIKAAKGAVPFAWSEIEWEHFCDLAARGLAATKDAWKEAIIEACIVNCISWDESDPVKSLAALCSYEVQIALDPHVSSQAQALIDHGKTAATGDTAKARALRDAAYAVIECIADDGTLNDARDAVFNMVPAYNAVDEWLRLCPAPTKTGESDG